MELKFFEYIYIITIFQLIFFAFFLLSLKKGNKLSNRILAVFLLTLALCYGGQMVIFFRYFFKVSPYFFFVSDIFGLILGPALFLYAQSLAFKDFKLKKTHLAHLLPFVLLLIGLMPYYRLDFAQKVTLLLRIPIERPLFINMSTLFVIVYTHFVIYGAFTLALILKYRSKIKAYYSSIEKINLSWLFFLVLGFMALWLLALSSILLRYFGIYQIITLIIFTMVFFLLINVIVYKGLRQPEIFVGIERNELNHKQTLSKSTTDLYLKQLEECMVEKKPHLIPSITLHELAEKASIPPRSLSHIINHSLSQTFFDFINKYRVIEAKRLLSDTASNPKTILDILYEVGFNSKSVFNTVFKKHTHMTPSEYRKKHQNP